MRFCHRPPEAGCHLQSLLLPTAQFSYLRSLYQRLRKAREAESFRRAPPVPSQPEPEEAESAQGMLHTTPVELATCFFVLSRRPFGITAVGPSVSMSKRSRAPFPVRSSECWFEIRLTAIGNCIGTKPSERRKADQVFFAGTTFDLDDFNFYTIHSAQNRRRDDLFGRTAMSQLTTVQDRHALGAQKSLVGIMGRADAGDAVTGGRIDLRWHAHLVSKIEPGGGLVHH